MGLVFWTHRNIPTEKLKQAKIHIAKIKILIDNNVKSENEINSIIKIKSEKIADINFTFHDTTMAN